MSRQKKASRVRAGVGGGGGVPDNILVLKEPSSSYPTTPHAREEELRLYGVTSARQLSRKYSAARISAAISAWLLQAEAGQDVGPGLLVYYIREGVEPGERTEDWRERRYKKAKATP